MGEFLKKFFERVKTIWSKFSLVQRTLLIALIVLPIIAIPAILLVSSAPTTVPILTQPVSDEALRQQIGSRLDLEGIEFSITPDFVFMAMNRDMALQARAILATEGLLPGNTDAWSLFDMDRWTITDYERDVNLRRSITNQLIQHIEALNDVDNASVTIVLPETALFAEDQDPVTASIIITPKPRSDITENRLKLEGIQELVEFAVPGLSAEYITIADNTGRTLNNFSDFAAIDRLELTRRELELKRQTENQYIRAIKSALSSIYTTERIEILNFEVELDYGNREVEKEEFFPIVITPDNPETPFSEREVTVNVLRSQNNFVESYTGSGFNPQGPPGVEGQTPPSYQDLEGLVGTYDREENTDNYEINRQVIRETGTAGIKRISVGVAIDGLWEYVYEENGNLSFLPDTSIAREYVPLSAEELTQATELIQGAIGYNQSRGDIVTVRTIPFDRSDEHELEDRQAWRQEQIRRAIPIVIIALVSILAILIIVRLIMQETERRRRLHEEEIARQYQAMREEALRNAEDENLSAEMSIEERERSALQEEAIAMARERPEEVAQLIRHWLIEE